jgi:DNA-binding transcriptional LysR family regulator
VDLDAVRTFVAVADTGRFAEAADDLSITQQAVSKRVAALERDLGVRLFARTARGATLTTDGRAFLPRARELLQAEERAAASVRPGRRALRVDVIGRRLAPAGLLRGFHRAHPETELDVVTLFDANAATATFGLTIDVTGPHFGTEPLLDVLAGSRALATFVGEQTHLLWPAGYDLRRVAVRDPAPVYPHSLIWRSDNPHPALAALRAYLGAAPSRRRGAGTWTPSWARRPARTPRQMAGS